MTLTAFRCYCFDSTPVTSAPMKAVVPAIDDYIRSAQEGHQAAFSEVVRQFRGRVFAMAAKYARNHHELDDLAQEVFIHVWKGLPRYRWEAPFEHWLTRIAVRCCFDFLRRHRRQRERECSRDALMEAGVLTEPVAPHEAEENAACAIIRQAMQRLKPAEQLILTLLELEDRSVRETAVLTGWSEANVKVRAHRARLALRLAVGSLQAGAKP